VPQGDLVPCRVGRGRRRVFERAREARVGLGLRGDAVRVEPITLALVSATLTDGGLVRWNVSNIELVVDEELGKVPAEPARALHSPAFDRPVRGCPGDNLGVSGCGVREVRVVDLAATCVEHGRGEGLAVWVNTNGVGCCHGVPPGGP
jgi:hypothetical protein